MDYLLTQWNWLAGWCVWAVLLICAWVWLQGRGRNRLISAWTLRGEGTALSWLLTLLIACYFGLEPGTDRLRTVLMAGSEYTVPSLPERLLGNAILPPGWLAVLSLCMIWRIGSVAAEAVEGEKARQDEGYCPGGPVGWSVRASALAGQVLVLCLAMYVVPMALWEATERSLTRLELDRSGNLPAEGIYLTNGAPFRDREEGGSNMRVIARPAAMLSKEVEELGRRRDVHVGHHVFAEALKSPQQHWDITIPDNATLYLRFCELNDARAVRVRELRVRLPETQGKPMLLEVQFISGTPRVIAYGGESWSRPGGFRQRAHKIVTDVRVRDTHEVYDPARSLLP